MNQDKMTKYVKNLLIDVQQIRSRCMEGYGQIIGENDNLRDIILAEMEPWLFGERNVLLALLRSLELGVSKIDVMNFARIVQMSSSLQFYRGVTETNEPDLRQIFIE